MSEQVAERPLAVDFDALLEELLVESADESTEITGCSGGGCCSGPWYPRCHCY